MLIKRQDAVRALAFGLSGLSIDVHEELVSSILPLSRPLLRSLQQIHLGKASPAATANVLRVLADVEAKMVELRACFHAATLTLQANAESRPLLLIELLDSYPLVAARAARCVEQIDGDAAKANDMERTIVGNIQRDTDQARRYSEMKADLSIIQEQYAAILSQCRTTLNNESLEFKTLRGGSLRDIHHLIEVHRDILSSVPSDWLVVNSTKKVVRFHTREIVRLHVREEYLQQQIDQLVLVAWTKFVAYVDSEVYVSGMGCVDVLATLDALCSLATVGKQSMNYSLPEFVDPAAIESTHRVLEIVDGRHPIIETLLDKASYISNSISLRCHDGGGPVLAISGPNMGGKTSLLRMCALTVILAQIGSFAPATRMRLSLFDGVFTMMQRPVRSDASSDSASAGAIELAALSAIARNATTNSLVVIDEIGFGMASHHASAVAFAQAMYFADVVGCFLLFATHLTRVIEKLQLKLGDRCLAKQFMFSTPAASENGTDKWEHATFHYAIKDGIASDSLAMDAARGAGLPEEILQRAEMSL